MNERDKLVVKKFKEDLPKEILVHIKSIIVFGSRARGDAKSDSDLDLAVLVDQKTHQIERTLEDMAYQTMWDFDFQPVISLKVFQQSRFDLAVKKAFSFYRHVVTQGVPV
jgi:predicted nucleotidyltransferase